MIWQGSSALQAAQSFSWRQGELLPGEPGLAEVPAPSQPAERLVSSWHTWVAAAARGGVQTQHQHPENPEPRLWSLRWETPAAVLSPHYRWLRQTTDHQCLGCRKVTKEGWAPKQWCPDPHL